ncbi:MAG: hypothetical protein HKO03_00870 [Acidimicrobiia bacterium]|nr:hypothetical protein [Acidimicrobiia bacterium]
MHQLTGLDYAYVPPFWPTAEERALLQAALLGDDRAVAAWATVDVAEAVRTYPTWSLLPLAFFNLKSLGVSMLELPDAAAAFSATSVKNNKLLSAAAEVVRRFAEVGISSVLLKGSALAVSRYPAPGTRPMFDVDIMVRPRQAMAAAALLVEMGFRPAIQLSDPVLRTRASAQFVRSDGVDIDLHWHALGGYVADPFDDALWRGTESVEGSGSALQQLRSAEQLVHVVAHALRNGKPGSHWWLDVALILRSWEPDDSERLSTLVSLFAMTLPLRGILRYLEREIGCDVPPDIFDALASTEPGRGEIVRSRILGRLEPDSTSAALMRSWATYSAVAGAERRFPGPFGFLRFTWQYLDSSSSDPSALAAVRRKLK